MAAALEAVGVGPGEMEVAGREVGVPREGEGEDAGGGGKGFD